MVTKHIYIIAYDISSNRRRRRVSNLLEEYGVRMNKGVFECILSTVNYKKLVKIINKRIDIKKDSVLYYPMCRSCFEKSGKTGKADFGSVVEIV